VTRVAQTKADICLRRQQKPLASVAGAADRVNQCPSKLAKAEREHVPDQVPLAREVAVDRWRRDRRRRRPDAYVSGVAGIDEEVGGGFEQLPAKDVPLTLSIAGPPDHGVKIR
jgi:hypothetical protein